MKNHNIKTKTDKTKTDKTNKLLVVAAEILCAAFYVMLFVFVIASLQSALSCLQMSEFKAACTSALMSAYFAKLFLSVPEINRRMIDPKVSGKDYAVWCAGKAMPLCRS
jgi:hypothetical protein